MQAAFENIEAIKQTLQQFTKKSFKCTYWLKTLLLNYRMNFWSCKVKLLSTKKI